jgi:hypothetical protein
VCGFVAGLLRGDHTRGRGLFAPAMTQSLNDYIEAQVHGELRLAQGVEAVVIDPAFRRTPAGELLLGAARRYGLQVEWHPGFVLALGDVPRNAPDAPGTDLMRWQMFCTDGRALRLAQRVVDEQGSERCLDAANIGQAAVSVVRDPARWQDWGEPHEVLVHLKDLWLMLVAHGQPLT